MSPDAQPRPARALSFVELPLAALEQIFLRTESQRTRQSLACTSKRLLVVSRCALLNADVRFQLAVTSESPRKADAWFSWLMHRRPHVQRLRIDVRCRRSDGNVWNALQANEVWTTMTGGIVACSPTLEMLSFHWPFPGVSMGHWLTAANQLEELRLQNHSLHVRECIVALPKLRVLSLDSQGAASLPWSRAGSCVTKLLLSVPGNQLPTGTTSLRCLVALVVDFPLAEVPVAGLMGLTSLAVVSASALELPPELAALTNLRQLILEEHIFPRGDGADHLSPLLAALSQLTLLSLSRCALHCLPIAVHDMTSLRDLLVDGCQMPTLPPGPYLARLSVLSADWGLIFNSAALLREQAPRLEHLYAMAACWPGTYDRSAEETLEELGLHPGLRRLTVLADSEVEAFLTSGVLQLLLGAAAALGRAGVEVRSEERGAFHPHTLDALSCFESPVDGVEEGML